VAAALARREATDESGGTVGVDDRLGTAGATTSEPSLSS
jgi:hypothetical protein